MPEDIAGLRQEIHDALTRGEGAVAQELLRQFWSIEACSSGAAFVLARAPRLRELMALQPFKLAILRSCTIEPVVPILRAAALVLGIDITAYVGAFNAYTQELLDPASGLYDFQPDAVILAVDSRDVASDLWREFTTLSRDAVATAVRRVVDTFDTCAQALRSRTSAPLIIHKLELPEAVRAGILDAQSDSGQLQAFAQIMDPRLRRMRVGRAWPPRGRVAAATRGGSWSHRP